MAPFKEEGNNSEFLNKKQHYFELEYKLSFRSSASETTFRQVTKTQTDCKGKYCEISESIKVQTGTDKLCLHWSNKKSSPDWNPQTSTTVDERQAEPPVSSNPHTETQLNAVCVCVCASCCFPAVKPKDGARLRSFKKKKKKVWTRK